MLGGVETNPSAPRNPMTNESATKSVEKTEADLANEALDAMMTESEVAYWAEVTFAELAQAGVK
jgi:hypothetical protein